MKMLKVVLGVPLLALGLTACGQEASEPAPQKEEAKSETVVHTKETNKDTGAVKEPSPNTLQTKATNLQRAVDSNEADMDYMMNIMAGYQYIQVGDNQYIYYGISQEQNVFSMMEVTFDNSGDYIQNINMIENASEEQIAMLQSKIDDQQAQLSDLEQQQMEKELDDYYAQLDAEAAAQKAQEEADAKAEAEAQAESEKQAKAEKEAQEQADKQAEEEEVAQAQAEADAQAKAEEEAAAQEQAEAEAAAQEESEQQGPSPEAMEQIEAANDIIADMGSWLSSEASQKIQEELAASGDGSSPTLDHCYRTYAGTEEDPDGFCAAQ
jgi:outer membrane biosynthesis protein TonB